MVEAHPITPAILGKAGISEKRADQHRMLWL
jgi:hypothetical protein